MHLDVFLTRGAFRDVAIPLAAWTCTQLPPGLVVVRDAAGMPMPAQLQHYASSLAAYRTAFYSVFSIGAVVGVIVNALRRHSNFYSMAVYLSRSNGTIVVRSFSDIVFICHSFETNLGHGKLWHLTCSSVRTLAPASILWATETDRH